MKTNNYWPAIVSTSLITALLWGTALPSAALPGPDDYKKTTDDVKKALATPTPRGVVPGPEDYKKLQDEVNKAGAASKAGALPAAPAPEDVNKALEAAKGNPAQGKSKEAPARRDPLPYTFYDRFTDGSQSQQGTATQPNPSDTPGRIIRTGQNTQLPVYSTTTNGHDFSPILHGKATQTSSVKTHESSSTDMHGWNKKNKKKHHDDDQDQFDNVLIGDYSQAPSSSHSHSASDRADQKRRAHKTANDTYDGSPIHYNKPQPMSDTEDWHKKNKNEQHHHDGDQNQGSFDNSTYDGSPIHYNKPKPTKPQGQDWLYLNLPKDGTAKKKHHHHGDD